MTLENRTFLITGAAHRLGRVLALAVASAGGNVIVHHGHSPEAARQTQADIQALGRQAWTIQANLGDPAEIEQMLQQVRSWGPLHGLVNNAAIFEPLAWQNTSLPDWQRHLDVNLTAPFLLSQGFARQLPEGETGRIVNLLDWRALRPGADHLPYTVSKAALAALTRSLAQALAPRITVNGMALGAILPPSDRQDDTAYQKKVLQSVPAERWAGLEEVTQTLLFLLSGPSYITGEIIHVDGGRHLV